MHAKQRNEAIRHVVAYVFTIAMVFLAVTPFIYVVLTALKTKEQIYDCLLYTSILKQYSDVPVYTAEYELLVKLTGFALTLSLIHIYYEECYSNICIKIKSLLCATGRNEKYF